MGALLAAASKPWFRMFIALAAFAGLRLGEAAAVQLDDVDFLRRTLQLTRQVQRGPGGMVEITPPKYGSERPAHLADGLLELLSVHATAVAEQAPRWLSSARATTRRTRTPSATGGAARAAWQASAA